MEVNRTESSLQKGFLGFAFSLSFRFSVLNAAVRASAASRRYRRPLPLRRRRRRQVPGTKGGMSSNFLS
jgi:hypothetical protein